MNDLTTTQPGQPSNGYSPASNLTVELAKMLSLVAPVTMTSEQQELWLRAAIDALRDIRPDEIAAVSLEVRRTVTRPPQIVPAIAKLVAERRSRKALIAEAAPPTNALPPPPKHVLDRRGEPMNEIDTAELNRLLEGMGATARYRPDGSRYMVEA